MSDAQPARPETFRWWWLQAFLILLAGTWVVAPTLHAGWYGDDDLYLLNNPLLNDPARVWKAWFQPGSFIEYYPIEQTVQWIQWKLWSTDDTFGYRVTNLVLHLTSALLIWRLLAQFQLRYAWLGGLLFAIHPLTFDSVAVISELKNTLSLPPFLLALSFYMNFEEHHRRRDYLLTLLFFLIAMLCKITMAFFPIFMLLYAWWKRNRITSRDLLNALPFLVISLVLGALTLQAGVWFASASPTPPPGPIPLGGFFSRIALAGLSLAFYLLHSLVPIDPMPMYPRWTIDPPSAWQFLPWLGVLALLYFCWAHRKGWGRHVLLGLGFFTLGLGPFLGFNTVSYMALCWVQDHFLYLPLLGLIALAVAGVEQVHGRLSRQALPWGAGVVTAIMVLLVWQTRAYAETFAHPEQLWAYNARYNPDNWFVRYRLGSTLMGHGDPTGAIAQLQESIQLNPSFANSHLVLAMVLDRTGHTEQAIAAFNETLRINPNFVQAHNGLGNSLTRSGRLPEAIAQYREALRVSPHYTEALNGLGNALLQTGDLPNAKAACEEALQLDPTYAEAHCTLGLVLAQMGQLPEAIEQFETAQRLQPQNEAIQQVLASLKAQQHAQP